MIVATSQEHNFDAFTQLQALMTLLGQFREIKYPHIANAEMNKLVTWHCGEHEGKYRFKGARLEADVNATHPDSMTTGMRLTFLMMYDGLDGLEQIQLFKVTANDQGILKGELVGA